MLLYQPRYRNSERMAKPANLAEAEAIAPGLTPVYPDSADLALDVDTPLGDRLAIGDPRLIDLLRAKIREAHELTLLRSDRAMTDCRPVSLFSIHTARQLGEELGTSLDWDVDSTVEGPARSVAPFAGNHDRHRDAQIRHLLAVIRRAAPFSSRPAPPTPLPCYERFPRW
jgi:hypothetical protein